ncbi:unnamed protein product [Soboliphyme baturini]|uniref:Endo/exonuclease/phosphatase domain-containing protein n=1 Tax=Soboliphyme baturini TaxID=241478 RepID=A0A183J2L4_9BILA|nr:unnamed protein product [Soboliphyme baturini]
MSTECCVGSGHTLTLGLKNTWAGWVYSHNLAQGKWRSGLLNLSGWKLFYSGVQITTRAEAGVDVPVEPNLADRIIDRKPISGKLYAPNFEGGYETFGEEVRCALPEVPNAESLILMGDFNPRSRR